MSETRPNDPYAKRGEEADRQTAVKRAEEELHLRNLMESSSGRWLLTQLVGDFERELQRRTTGHNSDDCYHRGIQDNAKKYRDLLVKHFGHVGIDRILKGI